MSLDAQRFAEHNAKTEALIRMIPPVDGGAPKRILVVGCGTGEEAGYLARRLGAECWGIDIGAEFAFDHVRSAPAKLMLMDAQALDFPDGHFDLVYSFHALEHIPDPRKALAEMARVLSPGGGFVVGTPNKSRMVGYIGSATSLRNKLAWNLADLKMRWAGKWSNEAGAHAGFTAQELAGLCASAFGAAQDVTQAYYDTLYASKTGLLKTLKAFGADRVLLPCVYVRGVSA